MGNRSKKVVVLTLSKYELLHLEQRGARADRGGGPQNRSRMIEERLVAVRAILAEADPRKNGRLSGAQYDFTLRVLQRTPRELSLASAAELDRLVSQALVLDEDKQAGLHLGDLLRALAALSLAEKAAMVDAAQQELFRVLAASVHDSA